MNNLRCLSFFIGLGIWSFTQSPSAIASAYSARDQLVAPPSATRIAFMPPAGETGSPRYTRGGASRTTQEAQRQCAGVQVLPESVSGLTTSAVPTLPVFLNQEVKRVSVNLISDDGSESYAYEQDTYYNLPQTGGFVEVPLPESVDALTLGSQYSWHMMLICDGMEEGPGAPVLSGELKRIAPVMTDEQRESLSLSEQADVYGDEGVWYDLIATLMQMRLEAPAAEQTRQSWESLMQQVGLNEIIESVSE